MRPAKLFAVLLFAALSCFALCQTGFVQVSAYPERSVSDGHSTVTITAVANSANGTPVPDGTQVLFQTDLGSFRDEIVTTSHGYAHASLIAGTIPGVATIKVKVLGLAIAPQETTVEYVANQSLLSSAKEYIEIVSPSYLKYSPQDKLIVAEAVNHGVSIRYREIEIHADIVQLNIPAYELRAKRAIVKIGRVSRLYQELNLTLNTHRGHGITTYTVQEADGIKAAGDTFEFTTHGVDLSGYVDVIESKVTPSPTPYIPALFTIANFDDMNEPALIAAKKVTVLPNKEVQFQKAELYLGDSKVLKMQLFKAPLNGGSPIFTDQVVNVSDNQLAISYPYYLSLRPGQTSLLRFHIGDHTNAFGNANGPQLDYELDWNRGDDMDGGLLVSGIGLKDWGIGLHQMYRFDSRTNAVAEIQMPMLRSVYGAGSISHQFNGYSANLNANVTETMVGPTEFDQSYGFSLDKDPIKFGRLPFHMTFGWTATHQSTSLPVQVQSQTGYGLESRLTMDPRRLDKETTLTGSFSASKLQGQNVTQGVGLAATLALNRTISSAANVFITYDYSQDTFTDSVLGSHRLTAQGNYQAGALGLSASASRSLGIDRVDYSMSAFFRLNRLWRLGYSYVYDSAFGTTFLDYQTVLYYRIGQREIGLVWSKATNRLGLQVLGATIY